MLLKQRTNRQMLCHFPYEAKVIFYNNKKAYFQGKKSLQIIIGFQYPNISELHAATKTLMVLALITDVTFCSCQVMISSQGIKKITERHKKSSYIQMQRQRKVTMNCLTVD